MLPGVEVARRRRMRAPAQRRLLDPPSAQQLSSNSATEGRRSRGSGIGSFNLAHHHHHHHHHHHYHYHASRSAARSPVALSTQVRPLQDLLQEQRAATSQQQNSNLSLLTSSNTHRAHQTHRDGRVASSGSRGLRGYRGEKYRLSTLAMLSSGQAHERRLQGAAMEARDRLDERLRSAALSPLFSATPPRQSSSLVTTGTTQYDMSLRFSDADEDENLWSDDEDWGRTMREWLAAWAASPEDRWQPDLFGRNHHHHSVAAGEGSRPAHKPREAGMSKAAFDAINRETYVSKKVAGSSWEQEDCAICLEKFLVGQGLLALPCNHKFHPNCLAPWLEGHEQCPYCRARISEDPSTSVQQQQQQQQQRGSASVVETQNSLHTNYFVSWMSAVEQGMSRLSHGSS